MNDDTRAELDEVEMWRCPQLGGPVTFGYCRVMNAGSLCQRMLKCWGGTAEVVAYLERHFEAGELARIFGTPAADRLTRIVDAIDGAGSEEKT